MIINIGTSKALSKNELNYSIINENQIIDLTKEILEENLNIKANEIVGEYGHFEITKMTEHRTKDLGLYLLFIAEAQIDVIVVGHKIIVI